MVNESGVPEVSEPRPGAGEGTRSAPAEALAAIYRSAESVGETGDFGALLDAVAALAEVSRGDVGRALNRPSSVYEWFRGSTIPATRAVARELAVHLDRAVADRHPDLETEIGDALLAAWDHLAEQRRLARVERGRSRHRPAAPPTEPETAPGAGEFANATPEEAACAGSAPPVPGPATPAPAISESATLAPPVPESATLAPAVFESATPVAPASEPATASRRRGAWRGYRGVVLAAVVLLVGAVAGFAGTRVVVAAVRAAVPPCAEAIAPHHSSGFVQLNIGYGPPGDPMAAQRVELRVQRAEDRYEWATAGWIAYAHLVRRVSEQDEVWLEWRSDEDGDGVVETYTCPATEVNQILQTPGIRVRDPYGERRWFRACAAVPQERAVPGRSRNNCTGWERPDD
ncbi:hypothetical protein JK358_26220 [Nocardia sp. 2]|uniref:XRE family transcriptional regulator n=1 Tax=Nocardia acididurans TaxID=2802282 RepID=A0ABS1MBF3_9NOCA|nr:hypothetical protein [Nocardia acididurans]MBL1077906.1 hypothetical protein [Nocardia acididurans]